MPSSGVYSKADDVYCAAIDRLVLTLEQNLPGALSTWALTPSSLPDILKILASVPSLIVLLCGQR